MSRIILIWIGLGILTALAVSGGVTTFHFYAPIRSITLDNGHYVNRAEILDMMLKRYVDEHSKKE